MVYFSIKLYVCLVFFHCKFNIMQFRIALLSVLLLIFFFYFYFYPIYTKTLVKSAMENESVFH